MSTFYSVAYRIGFTPWEALLQHRPFADTLMSLVARDEIGGPPYGQALDIGTGSGTWGVELAKRGWEVTGVDQVPRALRRAGDRAGDAGVSMRLVQADVTRLRKRPVGTGYRLLVDTGTFHGLDRSEQLAMGREITSVATADATVIIDAFAPGRRGPLPRGTSRQSIEEALPEWDVTDVVVADTAPDLLARALRFHERFYRLVRRA